METSNQTTIKKAFIFRLGKKKEGYEKAPAVSRHNDMVVIADEKLNVKLDVSYDCELIPMKTGRGYFAISATKTPVIKTTLAFEKGREGNMVSSFDNEIVIVQDHIHVEPNKEYNCEIVMSPEGKAYIVESVEPFTK